MWGRGSLGLEWDLRMGRESVGTRRACVRSGSNF